eukprot:757743-Hanusia_phi.AAC.2
MRRDAISRRCKATHSILPVDEGMTDKFLCFEMTFHLIEKRREKEGRMSEGKRTSKEKYFLTYSGLTIVPSRKANSLPTLPSNLTV